MASATRYRLKDFAGLTPARGTEPVAANTLLVGGTMVCRNASGYIQAPVDGDGFNVVGILSEDTDNRTTTDLGGGAGAKDATIEYGIFAMGYTGTLPKAGQVVYSVDNQTVSIDSDSAARGIAGLVSEVRDGVVYVLFGPTVAGMITIQAAVASDVTQAQTDIDTLESAVDALEADALSAQAMIPIPLTAWTDGGGPLVAFNDGVANGLALVDSEALGIRFNPVGEDTSTLVTSVPIPADLDDAADLVLHVLAFRVGAADTTTVLTGSAFFQVPAAAHTADADAITADSAALDSATTVVKEVTLTIAAADVPAAPASVTITLAPSSALDADDLVITSTWLEYTRKLRTA